MKKIIIMFAIGLLIQRTTQAQGTMTYLSNLGQPPTGTNQVGSDSWVASEVTTGNNPGGYMLNSVQLGMADASGNPNGFIVMIYSALIGSGINPGSSLGTLDGSFNPATAGTYTYTDDSNIILSRSTHYFIVLTAETTVANGAYDWSFTSPISYSPSGGWGGAGGIWNSSDGSSWIFSSGAPFFSLTATPIPEPSPSLLLLLGSGIFIYIRRAFRR